jgi:hypothetical protein
MIAVAKRKKQRRSERQDAFTLSIILAVVTLVLYAQVSVFGFINLDDPDYVYNNEYVQSGLTVSNTVWAFTLHGPGQWHPLTWISHQLDCQLFQLDAGMHHLVNAWFHVANTVLLFLVLRKMTASLFPSFLVAALFGWHPLSVESVAWVSERRDVLSTLFWLLTLYAYVGYARVGGWRAYGWVMLMLACGLMSKPMVVTLPCALLLLDGWPLRRWNRIADAESTRPSRGLGYLVGEKLPLLALSLIASVFTFLIQVQEQAVGTLDGYPVMTRLGNAVVSYATYLRKMVWPHDLTFFYPYPDSLDMFRVGVSVLVLLVLSGICLWQLRRRPYLLMGWCWYLGTLVPVIGLVQVGGQAMADRYTYVPLVGIYMALAWGAAEFTRWLRPHDRSRQLVVQGVIAAVVLVPCVVMSYQQVSYWKSGFTLNQRALELSPENAMAHNQIAGDYLTRGELGKSQHHFSEALRFNPRYIQPYMGLAEIAEKRNDPATAIGYLRDAQQRNEHAMAEPIIARRLAWLLAASPQEELRNGPEALVLAKRCVELTEARDAYCLHTLAVALAENQQFARAMDVASRALAMARESQLDSLQQQLRDSIQGYRQKKPFRDPRW